MALETSDGVSVDVPLTGVDPKHCVQAAEPDDGIEQQAGSGDADDRGLIPSIEPQREDRHEAEEDAQNAPGLPVAAADVSTRCESGGRLGVCRHGRHYGAEA